MKRISRSPPVSVRGCAQCFIAIQSIPAPRGISLTFCEHYESHGYN